MKYIHSRRPEQQYVEADAFVPVLTQPENGNTELKRRSGGSVKRKEEPVDMAARRADAESPWKAAECLRVAGLLESSDPLRRSGLDGISSSSRLTAAALDGGGGAVSSGTDCGWESLTQ